MRLSRLFAIAGTFVVAACLCVLAAWFSAFVIEDSSKDAVRRALGLKGLDWAEVDTNGLQVFLAGTAPNEAQRFQALTAAGSEVDATRIIDQMLVEEAADIAPPRFSLEILRNDAGLSLIGLIPAKTDRESFLADLARVTRNAPVTDLMEAADYPEPTTWNGAMGYAVDVLKTLPRTKISLDANRVEITAMAESADDKQVVETELARKAPKAMRLALNISAPRPVITPFSLRFLIEDEGTRFDVCSADTDIARRQILTAAGNAGLEGKAECTIGLGVPSPQWGRAAALSIEAVGKLGGGNVTMSDADIVLTAAQGVSEDEFDAIIGQLENNLPDLFALKAILPPPLEDGESAVPEFVVTLSPEGLVRMSGRVDSELTREAADSFAKARFSSESINSTARIAPELPGNWPLRVLAGVETMSYLSNGVVQVTPDNIRISGRSGNPDARAKISRFLSEKLGAQEQYSIDVSYVQKLDPVARLLQPEQCEAQVADILSSQKISFEPGSANVGSGSGIVIDRIASVLEDCGEIKMEIGGHTDSQGREEMNQQLSQARANTVLNELRGRKIKTRSYTAVGYGETQPIADNETEEGREVNRRIEFKLLVTKSEEASSGLDAIEAENSNAEESSTNDQN